MKWFQAVIETSVTMLRRDVSCCGSVLSLFHLCDNDFVTKENKIWTIIKLNGNVYKYLDKTFHLKGRLLSQFVILFTAWLHSVCSNSKACAEIHAQQRQERSVQDMDLGHVQTVWHVYSGHDRAKHGCTHDSGDDLKRTVSLNALFFVYFSLFVLISPRFYSIEKLFC